MSTVEQRLIPVEVVGRTVMTRAGDFENATWAETDIAQASPESAPTGAGDGTARAEGQMKVLITIVPDGSVTNWTGGLYVYDGDSWIQVTTEATMGTADHIDRQDISGMDRWMYAVTSITGASSNVKKKTKVG